MESERDTFDDVRGHNQSIYPLEFQGHRPLKREEFQQRDLEIPLIPGFILLVAGLWEGDAVNLRY